MQPPVPLRLLGIEHPDRQPPKQNHRCDDHHVAHHVSDHGDNFSAGKKYRSDHARHRDGQRTHRQFHSAVNLEPRAKVRDEHRHDTRHHGGRHDHQRDVALVEVLEKQRVGRRPRRQRAQREQEINPAKNQNLPLNLEEAHELWFSAGLRLAWCGYCFSTRYSALSVRRNRASPLTAALA